VLVTVSDLTLGLLVNLPVLNSTSTSSFPEGFLIIFSFKCLLAASVPYFLPILLSSFNYSLVTSTSLPDLVFITSLDSVFPLKAGLYFLWSAIALAPLERPAAILKP